jgi:hypothetical protein
VSVVEANELRTEDEEEEENIQTSWRTSPGECGSTVPKTFETTGYRLLQISYGWRYPGMADTVVDPDAAH